MKFEGIIAMLKQMITNDVKLMMEVEQDIAIRLAQIEDYKMNIKEYEDAIKKLAE